MKNYLFIDKFNGLRRRVAQRVDQVFAITNKRLAANSFVNPATGKTSFSLVTVNYSTTYYLKLMLITLCKQNKLKLVKDIVIVDNNSKDNSLSFLLKLEAAIEKISIIENRFFCHHARGVRLGINSLNKKQSKSNVILVCDTDIIFRNKNTLIELESIFHNKETALAGELRYSDNACPQAQASFLAIRRDIYARSDIKPFVYHGSPAYWLQKSIWKVGLHLYDFHSNFGGYILHRGRSGVAAASRYNPLSTFAKTKNKTPHYMGVENGEEIWLNTEKQHEKLLKVENEGELINLLSLYLKST